MIVRFLRNFNGCAGTTFVDGGQMSENVGRFGGKSE